MSAVMQQQRVTLDFRATRDMPRRLQIELSPSGHLYACIWGPGKNWQSLAGANASLPEAKLYSRWPVFSIGGTSFWLTASEASEIERVFGPLGLRIDRSELYSSTTPTAT